MVIVETTVWIDYLNGTSNAHTEWLERYLTIEEIGLIDLIFCEVLQGIREEAIFLQVRTELSRLRILSSGGADLAYASAKNYRFLRVRGITIRKTVDCLIATFCIRGHHSILHRDRDYDAFEKHLGLDVIHP